MKVILTLLMTMFFFVTLNCGYSDSDATDQKQNDKEKGENVKPKPEDQNNTFLCISGLRCKTLKEYCLVSKFYSVDSILTSECRPLSIDYSSAGQECRLAKEDAYKVFPQPASRNCDAGISCASEDGRTAVTCYASRM